MAQYTMVSGKKIYKVALGPNNGPMEASLRVALSVVKNRARVNLSGLVAVLLRGNSKKTVCMEKVCTSGRMVEITMDNGIMVSWAHMAACAGLMARCTQVSSRTPRS